jgi:hypothetical protein
VKETPGWMIKEVVNYAKALASDRKRPPAPNIDDYLDWCLKKKKRGKPSVGYEELDTSRLSPAVKERIRERWKVVQEYEDARKKQESGRKSQQPAGERNVPPPH